MGKHDNMYYNKEKSIAVSRTCVTDSQWGTKASSQKEKPLSELWRIAVERACTPAINEKASYLYWLKTAQ